MIVHKCCFHAKHRNVITGLQRSRKFHAVKPAAWRTVIHLYTEALSQQKRGKEVGQAQRKRQQGMQYRDVELWELYEDRRERDRGSRRRSSHTGNNRPADKELNIMLYEESRPARGGGRNSQARNRSPRPVRELQIQDTGRRRGAGPGQRTGAQTIYRGSARPVQSLRRRRARKRKVYLARTFIVTMMVLALVLIYMMTGQIYRQIHERKDNKRKPVISEKIVKEQDASSVMRPALTEDFLEINDFSRPGTELTKINNIFVHYTANPGTSAAQNRSYFANLALTQERSASAHLIIGYEGEIIQCIPFDEQAYAVMTRNEDSISIECCYVDADGSFTQETYDSLVHTLAWLTDQYDLSTQDIMRHYDCGGKKCPVYYVEHEDAWNRLLEDVEAYRQTCMKKH